MPANCDVYLLYVQFAEIEKILSEVDDACFGMYSCILHGLVEVVFS